MAKGSCWGQGFWSSHSSALLPTPTPTGLCQACSSVTTWLLWHVDCQSHPLPLPCLHGTRWVVSNLAGLALVRLSPLPFQALEAAAVPLAQPLDSAPPCLTSLVAFQLPLFLGEPNPFNPGPPAVFPCPPHCKNSSWTLTSIHLSAGSLTGFNPFMAKLLTILSCVSTLKNQHLHWLFFLLNSQLCSLQTLFLITARCPHILKAHL